MWIQLIVIFQYYDLQFGVWSQLWLIRHPGLNTQVYERKSVEGWWISWLASTGDCDTPQSSKMFSVAPVTVVSSFSRTPVMKDPQRICMRCCDFVVLL